MEGLVLKSTGSNYKVSTKKGILECKLGGRLRLDELKHTNPVSVGDRVILSDEERGLIIEVIERKNYLIRKATNLSKQTHIVAANIDQLIILASYKLPRTSTGFIDRVLATAEAYNIPAVVVFNKTDLLNEKELKIVQHYINVYDSIGYTCIGVSAEHEESVNVLKQLIKGKTNLFTGHSGVGKSTLVNKMDPELNLRTGTISDKFNKGKHTTTFAEMIPLSFGGYIIDTPGIKEFGMVNMDQYEVTDYFREMFELKSQCKFNNCLHVNEPGCAVIKAVEEGKVADFRYNNYLNILDTLE
jgi:ribosome biogenesis GTPase / thiamine phosphate phosphatase